MADSNAKLQIAVIDDDQFTRDFAKSALSSIANVSRFASGEEFISYYERNKPSLDLMVIDIVLGGLNGIELTKYVRTNIKEHHIPIVMFSSHYNYEMERVAFEAGATLTIPKGLSAQLFRLKIEAIIHLTKSSKT
jgi:two-component system phosphate regulon response regulator PhoB